MSGLVLVSPALATQPRNFLANADLGQLLRFAASRALLSTEGPGLTYVRNMIDTRRREVERVGWAAGLHCSGRKLLLWHTSVQQCVGVLTVPPADGCKGLPEHRSSKA